MPRIKLPKTVASPRVTPSGKRAKPPTASRPYMPGYGISASKKGLLPWSWAAERLVKTRIYWLTTITPKGEPHMMPIWGIWVEGRFYFSTGATSTKARNLAANSRCMIANENPDQAVMVHGDARRIEDKARIQALSPVYKVKYDFALSEEMGPVFELTPTVAFGQPHDEYAKSATRWRF